MSDLTDLHELFESDLGEGPAHRPTEARLRAGRGAVRRRRAAAAAVVSGAAVLAVLLGTGLTTPDRSSDPPVMDRHGQARLFGEQVVALGTDGSVAVRDGWTIARRVDNPLRSADLSLGADLVNAKGKHQWVLWTGTITSKGEVVPAGDTGRAPRQYPTFDIWLADEVALQEGRPMLGETLVRFQDGRLVPRSDEVELVRRLVDPQIPDNWGKGATKVGVAEVRYGGYRWYVIARRIPGDQTYYDPYAAVTTSPTLDGFMSMLDKGRIW